MIDTVPAGTAAIASDGVVDQQEEQRQFLLAAAGEEFDILSIPPTSKKKKKKTMTTKIVLSSLPRVDSGAESSGPDNQAPRNVDAQGLSKVEKDSTSETVDSGDARDDNQNDDAQNAAQRPNEAAKSIHDERKMTKAINPSTAVIASLERDDAETSLSHKKKPGRKRKSHEAERTEQSSVEQGKTLDTSPLTKKPKRASPKTPRRPKETQEADTTAVEGTAKTKMPPPNQLSYTVRCKIRRVQDFADNTLHTTLTRSLDNSNIIHIPERNLLGTLMRLNVDYELGAAESASLDQVEEAITARFTAPVGQQHRETQYNWVKFDANVQTTLEKEIQTKVAGYGLERINLIEMEMEMMNYELLERVKWVDHQGFSFSAPFTAVSAAVAERQQAQTQGVSSAEDMQEFYEETWQKVQNHLAQAELVKKVREADSMEQEKWSRKGVCPAPLADSV
ncbi:hypothetical protein KC363_g1229 [Hortaea werneckii]|nr:hypothetical protein KC361_g7902 [Hortaea werneckii]KAI6881452.1 hypothetical protein KC325_g6503 [Hortaea werneckii]KAI6989551.1 hypothetical protein KC359_g7147 [Hortaea werneckii]KAI7143095.1 hypothetical protein KC344_g6611 [Hortaea werneckii]KAI7170879.1 hypothetical protein KC360_g6499 [Hortaea werneckii]